MRQVVCEQPLAQTLNRLAGQGFAREHDLEAVVLRWIVAAGDAHARMRAEMMRGEVQHRCRHAADVNDVAAGGIEPTTQRGGQFRTGKAAIATDDHGFNATCTGLAANGMADTLDGGRRERLADDAADVVGLEDFRRQLRR